MPEQSLISIAAPKFLDNALSEPAKEVGHTLANIFHVVFGPINYPVEKYRMRQAAYLKRFKEDLQFELSKVPEENLVEPPLNIVGPALEASKFYIEEEELRVMFAKLIASSMNNQSSSKAHPSFVEIIKQLTTLDASNLKIISNRINLPIVKYKIKVLESGGSIPHIDNVFLENKNCENLQLIGSSLSNISRLGLINIEYGTTLTDLTRYDVFKNTQDYISLREQLQSQGDRDIYLDMGVVNITPLGKQFIDICTN